MGHPEEHAELRSWTAEGGCPHMSTGRVKLRCKVGVDQVDSRLEMSWQKLAIRPLIGSRVLIPVLILTRNW